MLFGGVGYLSDTWIWDGARWSQEQVAGPSGRDDALMATVGSEVVLFGGGAASGELRDTWAWSGTSWAAVNAMGPSARLDGAMAAFRGGAVLFGGSVEVRTDGGFGLDDVGDTWTFDGAEWASRGVEGPSARAGAAMATMTGP